jgi:hypothetical protein
MSAHTDKAIELLNDAESRIAKNKGLIGLDGFVDQIIRIVDKKQADGSRTFIPKIAEWGTRIQGAAGKSTKFELAVQKTKLGGNGPIMANAMAAAGLPLTCVGNMGFPELHPIFVPMGAICKMITIADASYTDAMEFEDGKIMLSRQDSAAQVTWETMEKVIGKDALFKLFDDATFVALNNWTSIPHMSAIWKKLQADLCGGFSEKNPRRKFFFDLADPQFRLPSDIAEAVQLISKFQQWYDVTMGLNHREAEQIAKVLNLTIPGKDREFAQKAAEMIRQALKIEGVVVHATAYATAASKDSSLLLEGPFTPTPLISTGAGDHFNAGYSLGIILGGDIAQRLQIGVATSGFYVRTAKSPTLGDLRGFLKEIA